MARGSEAEHKYPVPLTTHQLWIVSLCAPVNRGSDASRTTLYPFKRIDDERARRWLTENWEIPSHAKLLDALGGLAQRGYRAQIADRFGLSPLAWDIALYVDVVRNGFAAGHVDEPEAWRLVRAYGTRVDRVLGRAKTREEIAPFFGPLSAAEVRYLMKEEWARTADDILWRRSKLGLKVTPGATPSGS